MTAILKAEFGSAKTQVEGKLRRDIQSKNQLSITEAPETKPCFPPFTIEVAHKGIPNTGFMTPPAVLTLAALVSESLTTTTHEKEMSKRCCNHSK